MVDTGTACHSTSDFGSILIQHHTLVAIQSSNYGRVGIYLTAVRRQNHPKAELATIIIVAVEGVSRNIKAISNMRPGTALLPSHKRNKPGLRRPARGLKSKE